MRKLLVCDARGERELLMVGMMAVGRDPRCEISDSDPLLSRRHAEFTEEPGGVRVRDLQSRNGLQVNGVDVNDALLKPGDVVRIARVTIRFVDDAPPPLATAGAAAAGADAVNADARAADPDATVVVPPPVVAAPPQPDDDATVLVPFEAMAAKAKTAARPRRTAPRADASAARTPPKLVAWTTRVTRLIVGLSAAVAVVTAVPLWLWPSAAPVLLGAALLLALAAGSVVARRVQRIAMAEVARKDASSPGLARAQ